MIADIYPKEMWDGQLERLSHINPMDKIGLQYERYLMSVSFSGNSMDAQGRVLIPAKLRAKIGLTRDIVLLPPHGKLSAVRLLRGSWTPWSPSG